LAYTIDFCFIGAGRLPLLGQGFRLTIVTSLAIGLQLNLPALQTLANDGDTATRVKK
jgi:hypothetical protein